MKYGIIELHDLYDFNTQIAYKELVRCKECEAYMTDGYADGCGFCAYHQSVVKADDFCSYGEREGK